MKQQTHKLRKRAIFFLLMAAACNPTAHKPEMVKTMPVPSGAGSAKAALKKLPFDSKTDLVCGMPVSAGVEDTFRYKGKLYGFCATECKQEFVKEPEQYLHSK